MNEMWWSVKVAEEQYAAGRKDCKAFYEDLKVMFGQKENRLYLALIH